MPIKVKIIMMASALAVNSCEKLALLNKINYPKILPKKTKVLTFTAKIFFGFINRKRFVKN